MNKSNIISSIFKWPFAVVILRVLAAVILSFVIALIYFSPKDADLEEKIKSTKQELQIIDQQLKQRKTYKKTLQRHQALKEVSKQLDVVNANNRKFLKAILAINKTDNVFVSIETLENQSLSIKSRINRWNRFYAFTETIENMPITDRIIVNRQSNNRAELIWIASHFSGESQW